MTDESSRFDWSPYQQAWREWQSALTPLERGRVPARVAVEWVESPNGGAIARPSPLWNRDKSRHWIESLLPVPPAGGNGGLLGDLGAELDGPPWYNPGPEPKSMMPWPEWLRPVAPESLLAGPRALSPAPLIPSSVPMSGAGGPYAAPASEPAAPVQAPPDNPWLGRATVPSQPSSLEASAPRVEHLESAKYWGAAPPRTSAERMPSNEHTLSPVPQAPSWDQVSTGASAGPAQPLSRWSSPTDWGAPGGVGAAPPSPADEAAAVQDAAIAAAERMRRGVRRTTAAPDAPPTRDTEADAGELGLIERTRLNGVDSFYRGTLMGAGRLALMQHYASTPDEDGIDPQTKRWRDQLRKDYPQAIADLARYDRMRESGSASELGAAALGQLGGGLPSPESVVGVGTKAASLLWRLVKAGLQQGAANVAVDPVVQGLNIKAGVQDGYDPTRTAMGAGLGVVTGAGARAAAGALGLADGWRLFASMDPFTRAERLSANRARGLAVEGQTWEKFRREGTQDLSPQVTLRTPSGVTTRLDWMGRNPQNGEIICLECKGSATARLTRGQILAFPEIGQSGATVVGAGKPSFPGGTVIPPTAVKIIRP